MNLDLIGMIFVILFRGKKLKIENMSWWSHWKFLFSAHRFLPMQMFIWQNSEK